MPNVDSESSEIIRARERFEKLVVFENIPTTPPGRATKKVSLPAGALAAVAGIALGAYFIGLQSQPLKPVPINLSNIIPITVPVVNPKPRMAKILGLNTSQSEMTGVVDARTLTASYYWTFVVDNTSKSTQQAQLRMRLPEGAVVSRATLWVNGVAQEAAFNENHLVRDAFNRVFAQRRDPLLVTKDGPDHVLLKASPVPANGQMEFRVGITAPLTMDNNGTVSFKLPSVDDSNFGISQQRLHLESPTQLASSRSADVTSQQRSNGTLLVGQFGVEKLKDLQVFTPRSDSFIKFATRATHSYPAAYIVADIVSDKNGALHTVLTKSLTKPDCPILSSKDAAFRLSNLWSSQEVARLLKAGSYQQAVQIAIAYRVVSDVTGAVVLENENDYMAAGLHRNRYQSLAYMPEQSRAASGGGAGFGGGGDSFTSGESTGSQTAPAIAQLNRLNKFSEDKAPRPFASPQPVAPSEEVNPGPAADAPMLIGATNGTVGPQGADATTISGINTAATARVNKFADLSSALTRIGPTGTFVLDTVVASTRDANLFEGGTEAVLAPALFGLFVSIYAGGALLLLMSVLRAAEKKTGALNLALFGAAWLGVGILMPFLSQIILVATIIGLIANRMRRNISNKQAT
jgi:hypothetical protein